MTTIHAATQAMRRGIAPRYNFGIKPTAVRLQGKHEDYTYYTAEQVKAGNLHEDDKKWFTPIAAWAESLRSCKCEFPNALDEGTVQFAVCHTDGKDPMADFNHMRTVYHHLIDTHFTTLCRANAQEIHKNALIIAFPDMLKQDPGYFFTLAAETRKQARPTPGIEPFQKGIMVLGLGPNGPIPAFNTAVPVMAIRYVTPADKNLVKKLKNADFWSLFIQSVYGDLNVTIQWYNPADYK